MEFTISSPMRGVLPCILLFGVSLVYAQQPPAPSYYQINAVYLPPEVRPDVNYSKDQLKFSKAGGDLPAKEGENFALNLSGEQLSSQNDAARVVSSFLSSLRSPLVVDKDLKLNKNVSLRRGDKGFIDQQVKVGTDSGKQKVNKQFKGPAKSSENMVDEFSNDINAQSTSSVTVHRFDQYFQNTRIDNTAIVVINRGANKSATIQGKFYNNVAPANKGTLAFKEALKRAMAEVRKNNNKYKGELKATESLQEKVLLPYADSFRYAWKSQIVADGPYDIWIDAENGSVLQLLPAFFFADNASGLAFNPDPGAGTKVMTFEVDAPANGQYTLRLAGVVTLSNSGSDGTTGIVTIADNGSGSADFNVAPINGTVVERTNQAGYNGQSQQVNIYAHIFNERRTYMALGSQDFGVVNVTFNNPGGNAFCCPPSFHIGTATLSSSTSCNEVFNSGIDATVIAHEFGHRLNGLQFGVGGGTIHGALNEGMADFWACTNFNTDTFGGWWGHNCPTPVQSGWTPRQSEPLDIFPDRNSLSGASNEIHSAGQIISWAMWSARQGMNEVTNLGTLSINLNTIKAMTTAGIGVSASTSDKGTHDAYLDLLRQLAPLYDRSRLIHKLLAGYARAGIFLAEKDAVVDINDSYLDRASATGPVFTVWTGRDFTFSGSNVNTSTQPFNTQFMVEVANDEAFTTNLISSTWLSGVVAGAGGSASWTLPVSDWNTLKTGDNLFYRVTTKDAGGGNVRESWNPGNGFLLSVPHGKAAINGTGSKDCSCSASAAPSNSPAALLTILPLALLIAYRTRLRRIGEDKP